MSHTRTHIHTHTHTMTLYFTNLISFYSFSNYYFSTVSFSNFYALNFIIFFFQFFLNVYINNYIFLKHLLIQSMNSWTNRNVSSIRTLAKTGWRKSSKKKWWECLITILMYMQFVMSNKIHTTCQCKQNRNMCSGNIATLDGASLS